MALSSATSSSNSQGRPTRGTVVVVDYMVKKNLARLQQRPARELVARPQGQAGPAVDRLERDHDLGLVVRDPPPLAAGDRLVDERLAQATLAREPIERRLEPAAVDAHVEG